MSDDSETNKTEKDNATGKLKLLMVLVVFMVILSLSSTAVTVVLVLNKDNAAQNTEMAEADESTDGNKAKNDDNASSGNKPYFYKFMPTFTVNIPSKGRLRFLQVQVEVMSFDEEVISSVEEYAPLLKNDLVELFSQQEFDELILPSGKEILRKKALERVKKIMVKQTGEDGVEQVLFTSFITQ